jgi:hypothetical protein
MDDAKIHEFILHELTDGHSVDQVTSMVCERAGLSWNEASELVQQIQAEKAGDIALRQAPLIFFLAFATLITGIAISSYALWLGLQVVQAFATGGLLDTAQLALHSVELIETVGFPFFMGLAMILGSILGMQDVWKHIFEKILG